MKKYYSFVLAAFAIVAAASCSKEYAPVDPAADAARESKTFVASMDDTKATLSVDLEVLWEEGDQVLVHDNLGGNNIFTVQEGVGTKTAVLTGEVTEGATSFTAVFPASVSNVMFDGGEVFFTVPTEQELTDGCVDRNALISVGYTEGTELSFKNVVSLAKFTVGNDVDIKNVWICGNADEKCTGGLLRVNPETGVAIDNRAGSSYVRVNLYNTSGTYYACLAPVTFTKGIKVYCETNEDTVGSKTSSSVAEFTRNGCLNLGSIVPTAYAPTVITNAAELKAFSENLAVYGPDTKVAIKNDIDLSGVVIDAKGKFAGVLIGNNHTLSNWACTGAIVDTLKSTGVVEGIVVDNTCTITFPETPTKTVYGTIVNVNNGEVSNVVNNAPATHNITTPTASIYGMIVGFSRDGGILNNVVNNGSLTVTSGANTAGTVYYGTVAARTDGAETRTSNCRNTGAVNITFTGASNKNHYIGGVVGSATSGATLSSNENTGNVVVKTPNQGAALLIGGICPYASGKTTDCVNRGDISYLSESGVKASALAGICAYQDGTKGAMERCSNYGKITLEAGYLAGRNSIGGFDNTKSYSTMHATPAGICAYAYKCEFTECDNYGKIRFVFNDLLNSASTFSGRAHAAGVVGNSWGKIEKCNNYGDIYLENVAKDRADIGTKNAMPIVGGITGGDYASAKATQNETDVINCTNEGNISILCDCYNSNCAYGGIVGWPCKEAASVRVIDGCVNKGNITVEGANKCRIGGINGGTGAVKNCTNYGKIKVTGGHANCAVGGVSGFSTLGHAFENNANYGDVESDIKFAYGMGGLIGNIGNQEATLGAGCKVKCNVVNTNSAATQVGMIVGIFSGNTKAITVGTTAAPIKVMGALAIGDETNDLTEDNYTDYLVGPKNYTASVHTINAEYGE